MRSMIARAVGAHHISYANHVLLQSLTLTAVLAVIIIALVMWLTDFLLAIMGLSDAVIDQASGYMRVQIVAMMVLRFQRIASGVLQASGDSMMPLRAATATRVSHLILSPFLIFGWIGFPEMGLVQVFTQGFNTSGAMVAPMIITVSTMWLFEIPLAFTLATYTSLGQFGVPWAIVASMTLRLLFLATYYFSGKWLRTGLL